MISGSLKNDLQSHAQCYIVKALHKDSTPKTKQKNTKMRVILYFSFAHFSTLRENTAILKFKTTYTFALEYY